MKFKRGTPNFQKECCFLPGKYPQIRGVRIAQNCEGVVWVKVWLSKSLCLCQVQARFVPWGAKLCKPSHSGFLQEWWFLPRCIASQEKGLPNTGPVLAQHLAEYWSSTGSVVGKVEPSIVAPILAQYWTSP